MVHYWLAWSNLMGIIPFYAVKSIPSKCVIIMVMLASFMMHWTDTSHGLDPGPDWKPLSEAFYNLNLFSAIIALTYYLLTTDVLYEHDLICIFVCGLIFAAVGEYAAHWAVYTCCHTVWHMILYYALIELA